MKTKRLFSAILAACLTLALILPASAAGTAPSLDDAVQADAIFTVLMGEKVEPRKEFIEKNAKYAVNLDY